MCVLPRRPWLIVKSVGLGSVLVLPAHCCTVASLCLYMTAGCAAKVHCWTPLQESIAFLGVPALRKTQWGVVCRVMVWPIHSGRLSVLDGLVQGLGFENFLNAIGTSDLGVTKHPTVYCLCCFGRILAQYYIAPLHWLCLECQRIAKC